MAPAGGEKSTFRWLDVVRYAVAAVVTVVVAAVVVAAIKVVFRPDSLTMVVTGNYVNITGRSPLSSSSANISLQFTFQTTNPSGRVRMYYTNISIYLFDNGTDASTANPDQDCILGSNEVDDIAVPQLQSVDNIWTGSVVSSDLEQPFSDILYKPGGELSDVTMRVDGYLTTELLRNSTTPAHTIYYCKQLLVAAIPPADDDTAAAGAAAAKNLPAACTTSL